MVLPIRLYQIALSPFLGPACRFYPTCSEYALEAILRYGPFKGSLLAVRRVLKCHPYNAGGVDLVPERACRNGIDPVDTH
jgi:hypothetical protein